MSKFMITDGHGRYLCRDANGNFSPCKNKLLGYVWEQRSKAANILVNCVNKNLRNRYRILEIEDGIYPKKESKQVQAIKSQPVIKPKNDIAKEIGNEAIEENQIEDLTTNIDNFADFVQSAEQRKDRLLMALSDVDKEISDINHYIELGENFNTYQGWLAFNMLKNRLKKRRKIKDELHILIQLGECKVNSAMIAEIKKVIGGLDTREYQPRILKQLFE